MTPAQINKKYQDQGFVAVFSSTTTKGVFTKTDTFDFHQGYLPFSKVKAEAIKRLSSVIENHHGRGEHTVTIYGLVWAESRKGDELRIFGSKLELVSDTEVLFTL
jgi:hypothetical protein